MAATSGTTAGQATSTLIPISTEQQVINNLPATSAQTSTDAELSTKSKTMASPKPDQGKSIELDKMKSGNDLSAEKGIKQECPIPVDDICSRSGKSVDGNVQATSGNEKVRLHAVRNYICCTLNAPKRPPPLPYLCVGKIRNVMMQIWTVCISIKKIRDVRLFEAKSSISVFWFIQVLIPSLCCIRTS